MIDKEKLEQARRALLDTNVLIYALDGGTKHPDHKLARALVDALAEKKIRVLVAAPSFAEFQMKMASRPMPLGQILEVVPFDHDAARLLAEKLPIDHLKQFGPPPNTPFGKHLLKYDSMIVACAARFRASCLISTDEQHMPKIAAEAGVRCLTPKFFEKAQQSLFPRLSPVPDNDE